MVKKNSKTLPVLTGPVVGPPAAIRIVGIGGLGLEVIKALIMERKTTGQLGYFLTDCAYHRDALGMEVMRSITWNSEATDDLEYIAIDTLGMPYLLLGTGIPHKSRRYYPLEGRKIGAVTADEKSLIVSGIEDAKEILVVAGMGQETGTCITPAVITIAAELRTDVTAIVTRPFLLEGKEAAREADRGIRAVTERARHTAIIDLETISRDHRKARTATVKGIYDEGKEAVRQKVKEYLQKNINRC